MKNNFPDYLPRLQSIVDSVIEVCGPEHPNHDPQWVEKIRYQQKKIIKEGPIRIAFIGEFSAGKSSLISALTGQEIQIDADVTTNEINEYKWRGTVLVDTPGIQSDAIETNHDLISKGATIGSDLILFLVTNELINPRLAERIQYIIEPKGLNLSSKTAIVINKMDRETNPEEALICEIDNVLGEFNNLPVWFCSSGRFLQAKTADDNLYGRFVRQSRIEELKQNMDAFIRNNGVIGRLTTPLQIIEDVLDEAQKRLVEKENPLKQLELLRRQKRIFNQLEIDLIEIKSNWKRKVYAAVIDAGEAHVNNVNETTSGEDIAELLTAGMKSIEGELDSIYDDLHAAILRAFEQCHTDLEDLSKSPLAQNLGKLDIERPANYSVHCEQKAQSDNRVTISAIKSALPIIEKGLKKMADNPKELRDSVYKIGKAFGKKFRPWEAVNKGKILSKIAQKGSKAFPFVAFAFDFYMNVREEKDKEKKEKHLANMRIALRKTFADQAHIEGEVLSKAIEKINHSTNKKLKDAIDREIKDITSTQGKNKELAGKMYNLKLECGKFRDELM
jgi:GTPase SAR1 family protein